MRPVRVLLLFGLLTACGGSSDPKATATTPAAQARPAAPNTPSALPPIPGPAASPLRSPARYRVRFTTTKGDFVVDVTRSLAPHGADRFYELVTNGFYRGTRFYRVVPGFVTQWGIHGDTAVSAKWRDATIPDDPRQTANAKGTIAFAANGPNSRATEVFVATGDNQLTLDRQHFAPFGRVVEGFDVVEKLTAEYGEEPVFSRIARQGNTYLEKWFPALDYVKQATIVPSAGTAP